jgi:hypothetical protein
MRSYLTAAAVSAVLAGQASAQALATPSADNPAGVGYKATLPDGPVSGSISAVAAADGEGIAFTVDIDGLTVGGPWSEFPDIANLVSLNVPI